MLSSKSWAVMEAPIRVPIDAQLMPHLRPLCTVSVTVWRPLLKSIQNIYKKAASKKPNLANHSLGAARWFG